MNFAGKEMMLLNRNLEILHSVKNFIGFQSGSLESNTSKAFCRKWFMTDIKKK